MTEYKEVEFARAERASVKHLWDNLNYIAETKEDGHRASLQFGGACSRMYMTSRNNEEFGLNVVQFAPAIDVSCVGLTILDGEILPPVGSEFHNLTSYTRVSPQVAQKQRKKTGEIKYKVFDILFLNGQDVRSLPLETRIKLLEMTLSQVFPNHPFVSGVARAYTNTYKFFLDIVANNGEGAILKDLRSSYGGNWFKAKRNSSVDVIIVGYEEGYDVPCGVFKIAVIKDNDFIEVGKCGILDAQVRAEINKDPRAHIGKIIEIKGLKYDPKSGKIREPIFSRMRPDLSILDATFDKLQRDFMVVVVD